MQRYEFIKSHSFVLRLVVYFIAFDIRFILAIFFQDGSVFYDTGLDIFVNHSILYANTILQSTFNYFPFAYLVTLPQIWLYYQLPIRSNVLLRIMFKLPIITADLVLASLFSDKVLQKVNSGNLPFLNNSDQSLGRFINNFELFILFNPLNIYISGMTNQIDMFPAILLVLSWYAYKNNHYFFSGMAVMTAFLIKEYAIFLMIFLFIAIYRKSFHLSIKYILGNLIIAIPTILVVSLINFQGFIQHAIIYQLFRQPIGSSLSAFVFEIGKAVLPSSLDSFYQSLISFISFGIIFIFILVGSISIFKDPTDKKIIFFSVLSFLTFCLFNKVFWPQYLVSLFALWILYRIEYQKTLSNEFISWTVAILPIFLLLRSGEFATQSLVYILGLDFFTNLLLITFALHFILLISLWKMNKINIRHRKFVIAYCIIFTFIISQIFFQWYLIHLPSYTLQKMPH